MSTQDYDKRPGEIALAFDPCETARDGAVVFVGRIRSPWKIRSACPKNLAQARERGVTAHVEIDAPFRPGLQGLAPGDDIILLYWMHEAKRNLIVQKPRHRPEPCGVFALRSPARPNPIAMGRVRIVAMDVDKGRLEIDAIDCLDGTALLDIKPWIASVDGD